jgi:hypothetical protein
MFSCLRHELLRRGVAGGLAGGLHQSPAVGHLLAMRFRSLLEQARPTQPTQLPTHRRRPSAPLLGSGCRLALQRRHEVTVPQTVVPFFHTLL